MSKLKKLIETYERLYGKLEIDDVRNFKSFDKSQFYFKNSFDDREWTKNFLLNEIRKCILIEIKPPRTKFSKNARKKSFHTCAGSAYKTRNM